jgi:RNA-directed DNA polymerase
VASALGASPHAGTAETVAPQTPHAAEGRPGQQTVHALIDTGCRRTNGARAWEKGTKHRGGAGIDAVTSAPVEARQEDSLALLHGTRRAGTSQPKPVTRVEIPPSEGGVSTLGLPRVWARVCPQALVPRMEPIVAPPCLESSLGSRQGRAPQEAMRQVWRERKAGQVGRVEADLRQVCDTSAQEQLIDLSAAERRDGRVLPRVRDRRRAGVMAAGSWRPTRTGVPQGGVASPRWSNVVRTPLDRQMAEAGCRLTRGADDFVGRCQTREEAPRAWAIAARCLREALGVERQAPKTRLVHVSPGFECLGDQVQQGTGHRRPASKRRGRSHPQHRDAIPRAKAGQRFQEQMRSLTRRQAPLKRREVSARITPVSRGWGHFSRTAAVKRLCPRLDRWIAHRLDACLAKRWRHPLGRQDPPRRLSAEFGWVRLTHLIPGLVRR